MPGRHIVEMELLVHSFLTSTLDGVEWLISRPDRFAPGQNSGTNCVRARVNPTTGLGDLQTKTSRSNPEPCSSILCHVILGRNLIFRRRIKTHLPFAGIIRRLPYFTRFKDKD